MSQIKWLLQLLLVKVVLKDSKSWWRLRSLMILYAFFLHQVAFQNSPIRLNATVYVCLGVFGLDLIYVGLWWAGDMSGGVHSISWVMTAGIGSNNCCHNGSRPVCPRFPGRLVGKRAPAPTIPSLVPLRLLPEAPGWRAAPQSGNLGGEALCHRGARRPGYQLLHPGLRTLPHARQL